MSHYFAHYADIPAQMVFINIDNYSLAVVGRIQCFNKETTSAYVANVDTLTRLGASLE